MLNVFVYGTLRAGEANDIHAASPCRGIAAPELIGITTVRGRLFDFGKFPGMVLQPDGVPVVGEVYAIDDALLPSSMRQNRCFARQSIQIAVAGQSVPCLFYPVSASAALSQPEIGSGDCVRHRR